jgi:hypothetical protein
VVVAPRVIHRDMVFVGWFLLAQIHEAICSIVSAWFSIRKTAQPPWGTVRCFPRGLVAVLRVHGIRRASTTTILGPSDIDNPIWFPERGSRSQECFPISSCRRREDLRAMGTTALVFGPAYIKAAFARHERPGMIVTFKSDTTALARLGTAFPWRCWNVFDTTARNGSLALGE